MKILNIKARQILDSRGNPTVEALIKTKNGVFDAKVPSGASTGVHEALELRDKSKEYGGKSVLKAVSNINNKISKSILNKNFNSIEELDNTLIKLDGTNLKKKLGANAILGVSMAGMRALASENNMELYKYVAKFNKTKNSTLPLPFANVINGGVHAANDLEMQEFMIVPVKAKSFSESTRMVAETYHILKGIIAKKYGQNAVNVGDEGGFAPPIKNAEEALNILVKGIEKAGYTDKIKIAMDTAASEFFNKKTHTYLKAKFSSDKIINYYNKLIDNYPIISLEDPFAEDDFSSWKKFMASQKKVQIVGDDLTVTNTERIEMAAKSKLCNALLLKVNQIGSVSESINSFNLATKHKWNTMVSHRSGETEDAFISDLAVGLGNGQIKLGAPCRSDRVAKYNRLLAIEDELGKKAKLAKF